MSSFETLINEHEMLGRAAAELEKHVQRGAANVLPALKAVGQLAMLLDDHLSREDEQLYPQLIACGDVKTAQLAEDFSSAFLSLREDWDDYLERWATVPDGSHWPQFCAETRLIVGRLLERIRQENNLLYPAALEASIITLRARAA